MIAMLGVTAIDWWTVQPCATFKSRSFCSGVIRWGRWIPMSIRPTRWGTSAIVHSASTVKPSREMPCRPQNCPTKYATQLATDPTKSSTGPIPASCPPILHPLVGDDSMLTAHNVVACPAMKDGREFHRTPLRSSLGICASPFVTGQSYFYPEFRVSSLMFQVIVTDARNLKHGIRNSRST